MYESVEGVDECDTAVLMYECGKEKMPDLVTDLVINTELKQGVKFKIAIYFRIAELIIFSGSSSSPKKRRKVLF
jgi:hypothetical protein